MADRRPGHEHPLGEEHPPASASPARRSPRSRAPGASGVDRNRAPHAPRCGRRHGGRRLGGEPGTTRRRTVTAAPRATRPGRRAGATDEPDAGAAAPGAGLTAVARAFRDLRSSESGLGSAEAARRLAAHGPNELVRSRRAPWPREILDQVVHPLALLLWAAAGLAALSGTPVLALAIAAVVVLNAVVAFAQERQAERAVDALRGYLPAQATVRRDGRVRAIAARDLVPGDVLLLTEGERVSADARLVSGEVEVDMSALTGEAAPVTRAADREDGHTSPLEAQERVFSGTLCTAGEAVAVVRATGMRTELGRIAALSQRGRREMSPLEREVKRAAWIIALVAVAMGAAFLGLGWLAAGLPADDALRFAIGLLVANVPEGLLPTITLALAVCVRTLSRRGALVKRLSAVETLGAATVICTDKTGTLTLNRMRPVAAWTLAGPAGLDGPPPAAPGLTASRLGAAIAACANADLGSPGGATGDPTEVAMLEAAAALGAGVDPVAREARRRRLFHFHPARRMMATVDEDAAGRLRVTAKGAPEALLARATRIADAEDAERPLGAAERAAVSAQVEGLAARGLRVLAVADRPLGAGEAAPSAADAAERDLCLIGLVAMHDPPRPAVPDAVARCRRAGIAIVVVTGDNGVTAAAIAREVGIVRDAPRVVAGPELSAMDDAALSALLRQPDGLIFARAEPEAKLRIAEHLRAHGAVVAMTGDGVNDAPALRHADIGVAMGRSGTDVAREAATMILTDDDFATVVAAIEEGRRVYANVRRFILYIFAHAPPEVLPFLAFALSGGAIPLPLTVMQLLAIDLGTETVPALALGRERAERDVMDRPPRARTARLVDRALLRRAWGGMGIVSAALVMAGFVAELLAAGWSPGDPTGDGAPLHEAYLRATTMTFLGIVACQIGTAMASRVEDGARTRPPLRSNRLLVWGIILEVVLAIALVGLPPLQPLFGTAVPSAGSLAMLAAFPPLVYAADALRRRRLPRPAPGAAAPTAVP
nr:cation-transporting P-type ATPase [Miltoncostaea marina]